MHTTKIGLAIAAAAFFTFSASGARAEDEMSKALTDLKNAISRLDAAEKNLAAYMTQTSRAIIDVQNDMDVTKARVKALEDQVRDLKAKLPPTSLPSTSYYRPDVTEYAPPRLGMVKLMNEYPAEMSVVLNGIGYRLAPGESRTVKVPPGKFTYQILNLQRSSQERYIAGDEEKYIRIFNWAQ